VLKTHLQQCKISKIIPELTSHDPCFKGRRRDRKGKKEGGKERQKGKEGIGEAGRRRRMGIAHPQFSV